MFRNRSTLFHRYLLWLTVPMSPSKEYLSMYLSLHLFIHTYISVREPSANNENAKETKKEALLEKRKNNFRRVYNCFGFATARYFEHQSVVVCIYFSELSQSHILLHSSERSLMN